MKLFVGAVAMMAMIGTTVGSALAEPPGERAGDRQELREDRRETRRDVWDTASLQALLNDYVRARKARDAAAISALDQRFMAEIVVEVRESKVETVEKVQEVGASRRDHDGRGTHDRRELRDDRRDLVKESAALQRKKAIRDAYARELGQLDARSVLRKEALIKKAIGEAKLEVVHDVKEQREDRRELREDRR